MNALNVTFLADGEENDRPLVVSQIVDNNNKKKQSLVLWLRGVELSLEAKHLINV